MEGDKSAFLVATNNHNGASLPHKKSFRSPLTNGIETNEATLVSEANSYAAHRFRNGLGVLQVHSKRHRTPTLVTSAVVVKPEPPKMALMEVNEEDEDFELENNQLNSVFQITKLSREDFIERSRELLTRPESLIASNDASVSASQLRMALSTALARNMRLQEQRQNQTSRYLQLQRHAEALSAELDASVDNLRHQKTRWETEKRRSIVEARELRQQLSEALAAAQNSPKLNSHRTDKEVKDNCSECVRRNLDISALRIAVERLEGELARQRQSAEQESANFSIQLANAAAENRSLRLQLSRSAVMAPTSSASINEGSCAGCKRLQQLLDVLQKKKPPGNSTSEAGMQTESVETPEDPILAEDGDTNLFQLLESRGRINDLTTEYLEQQLGEPIQPPQRSTAQSSLPPMIITPNRKSCPKVETDPPDVSRLLERLKNLEAEAESSAEQLKASNDEFLQLRERLTSAIIEKTHLKAQLDASNDRTTQLESVLYERTKELERLKNELLEYRKPQSCVLKLDVESGYESLNPSPQRIIVRQTYSKCQQMFASVSKLPFLLNGSIFSQIGSLRSLTGTRVLKAVDYRLIGSRRPRVVLFIVLIFYLCFLHILLANSLLQ